jgi:hypothetical protein
MSAMTMSLSSSRPMDVDPGGASAGTPGRKTRTTVVMMSKTSVPWSVSRLSGVVVRLSDGKSPDSTSWPSSNVTRGPSGAPMWTICPSRMSTEGTCRCSTKIPFVLALSIATQRPST